jgi:hypothetical protein
VAGALSSHGVVVMGAGRALVWCLLGEGRLSPPLRSGVLYHGPLRVEPVKAASKWLLLRVRLRLPK